MKLSLVISCLLVVSALLPAQEDKPVLFINTNSYHGAEIGPDRALSQFAELAEQAGFQVKSGWHWSITETSLADVDLYVLPEYVENISSAEKKTIKDFVRQGGSLLVLSWFKNPSNLKSVMREFGIIFGEIDTWSLKGKLTANSPLKGPRKCNSLQLGFHRFIYPANDKNARGLAQDSNGKFCAVESLSKNLGLGKVIVCGDLSTFISSTYPEGKIGMEDNSAFVFNLLWYLQAAPDLAVKKLKLSAKEVIEGGKIAAKLTINNIGDQTSKKTQLGLFLSHSDTTDPGFDDELIPIRKVILPEITSGKRKRIAVKLKIPAAPAGQYYLMARIDPENKSKEKRKDNNIVFYKIMVLHSEEYHHVMYSH